MFTELQYAYLGKQETYPDLNGSQGFTFISNASNQYLYTIGLGFEVKLYKKLLLKQRFAGGAHFDSSFANQYNGDGLVIDTFNGLSLSIQGGLAYIF